MPEPVRSPSRIGRLLPLLFRGALLAIVVFGCAGRKPDLESAPASEGEEPMSGITIDYDDDQYYDDPFGGVAAVETRMEDEDFDGMVLGGPKFVDLKARDHVNLLAFRQTSIDEDADTPFDDHAVLVGVDLTRNRVWAGSAARMEENQIPDTKKRDPMPGTTFGYHLVNATGMLGMPWKPGQYLFTLLLRDQVTNRVEVEVGFPGTGYQDEEVIKFVESQRPVMEAAWPVPRAESPFPTYERRDESPAVPDEPGIALSVSRVNVLKDGLVLPLYGSFRLALLTHEIVPPVESLNLTPEELEEQPVPRPMALVPVSLVIMGSEQGFITSTTIMAPIYEPVDPKAEGQIVTGHFALDMMRIRGMIQQGQTYFVYAVSGSILEPAVLAALVPEELIEN